MKRSSLALRADNRGVGAIEFALAGPILIMALMGIAQIGILFQADAGLQHALGQGARFATIFPRPTDAQIVSKMNSSRFGLISSRVTVSPIVHGTSNGASYADITMHYSVPLDFIFFTAPSVTLTHTRRVFQQ